MASAILLSSLASGVEWLERPDGEIGFGNSRLVYVYSRGTTDQVNVFHDDTLTGSPLTQPLTTGATGIAGAIPGWVVSGQSIDFVDAASGQSSQGEALAAQDVIGTDGTVGGPGSLGLAESVESAASLIDTLPLGTVIVGDTAGSAQDFPERSILHRFGISGSAEQWTGSNAGSGSVITTTADHDFKVGHGIRVWKGGNSSNQPPTGLTVTPANAGSTSIGYAVSTVFLNSYGDVVSAAATASTTTSMSSLSPTNYNKISFVPPASLSASYARMGFAIWRNGTLIGTCWHNNFGDFGVGVEASAAPSIGSNLAASTTYTYAITGVDFQGNETPILNSGTVTTGSTLTTPYVTIGSDPDGFDNWPYEFLNVYRATGAGPLGYVTQIPISDQEWCDYGNVAPSTGRNPPTVISWRDTGQAALTVGGPGAPYQIPASNPSTTLPASYFGTVTAVTQNTITVIPPIPSATSGTRIDHDDTVALHTALSSTGEIRLPANSFFMIGQEGGVSNSGSELGARIVGSGGLDAQSTGVSASSNPLPNSALSCLVATHSPFTSTLAITAGSGCQVEHLGIFHPFQANGDLDLSQYIPYAPAIRARFANLNCVAREIVPYNAWIGVDFTHGNIAVVENLHVGGVIRWGLMIASESQISDIIGDTASSYASNVDQWGTPDSAAVRGFVGSNCLNINNVGVDATVPVWITTSGWGSGSISQIWSDDQYSSPLILDSPVSPRWETNLSGTIYQWLVSNVNGMAGTTSPIILTCPLANRTPGANAAFVRMTNVYGSVSPFALKISGQIDVGLTNCQLNSIEANSSFVGLTPSSAATASESGGLCRIEMAACVIGPNRFTVNGGLVAVKMAACDQNFEFTDYGTDTVTSGTLYVVEAEATRTLRFSIPSGTVLTAGSNVVGRVILPAVSNGNVAMFNVVSALAAGTTTTDYWTVNGHTVVTTATSSGGVPLGSSGENGSGNTILSPNGPVYQATLQNQGISSMPVAIDVASNVTTSTELELQLTYCLTPTPWEGAVAD